MNRFKSMCKRPFRLKSSRNWRRNSKLQKKSAVYKPLENPTRIIKDME